MNVTVAKCIKINLILNKEKRHLKHLTGKALIICKQYFPIKQYYFPVFKYKVIEDTRINAVLHLKEMSDPLL